MDKSLMKDGGPAVGEAAGSQCDANHVKMAREVVVAVRT